jgi:hypothetical protein
MGRTTTSAGVAMKRWHKEKLRSAVPPGATVVIYKTTEEFNAVVRDRKGLEWIQRELRSLPDTGAASSAALQKQ